MGDWYDTPRSQCSGCGRKTWNPDATGTACGMTQPDGRECQGTFSPPLSYPQPTPHGFSPDDRAALCVPVSDHSETLEFRQDLSTGTPRQFAEQLGFVPADPSETLALIAEYKLGLRWVAWDEAWQADCPNNARHARAATIGDAVRACVARIKDGRS